MSHGGASSKGNRVERRPRDGGRIDQVPVSSGLGNTSGSSGTGWSRVGVGWKRLSLELFGQLMRENRRLARADNHMSRKFIGWHIRDDRRMAREAIGIGWWARV